MSVPAMWGAGVGRQGFMNADPYAVRPYVGQPLAWPALDECLLYTCQGTNELVGRRGIAWGWPAGPHRGQGLRKFPGSPNWPGDGAGWGG